MNPPRWMLAATLLACLPPTFGSAHAQKINAAQAPAGRSATSFEPVSCKPPAVPIGGLPVRMAYDNLVVYSDGYQTLADLTVPSGPAPVCGWPLVVVVHGLPGSRQNQRPLCEFLAGRGYAAWAYEVRGQSDAIALNPGGAGFDWYGADYKFDLAEQIAHVRATYPFVHPDRVAVTGRSQGAIHSWFAAAYSNMPVAVPGRGTIQFPQISCVIPQSFNADVHDQLLRSRTMFNENFVNQLFTPDTSFLVKDPAFVATAQAAFLAQDPEGLYATWQAEPDRIWTDKFDQARGPVLWMHAYLDNSMPPTSAMLALSAFPATTEKRALLSTVGHSSPGNDYESEHQNDLRLRWLERFLWDVPNQVELEPPVVYAGMPSDENVLVDLQSLWGHRQDSSFVPTDAVVDRLYFDVSGQLVANPPAVLDSAEIVHGPVTPGFDANDWAAAVTTWNLLSNVLAEFPLSEIVLTGTPLAAETEIVGRPTFNLSVEANQPEFQLAASLEAVVPGNTAPLQLGQWASGVRNATPGQADRISIKLPAIDTVLPTGTVLQVRLRNLWINEAPMVQALQVVPYFTPVRVTINMGPGQDASFLTLPMRSRVRLAVKTSMTELDLANPTSTFLEIEGGETRAGHSYQVLLGASGQLPGYQSTGPVVPVTPDTLTQRITSLVAQGHPGLIGLEGVLDAQGKAVAEIQWQNLASLAVLVDGQRVVAAALTTSGSDQSASNAVDFPAD